MRLLRDPSDIRTVAFVASFFASVFVLWNYALPWWVIVPLYAWTLVMAMVAAVINHNALHCPVFRARPANRVFQVLLSFIYGMPVSLFVPVHNLSHHKHSQTNKDVMRSMKLRSKWNLIDVLRAPTVMGIDTVRDDIRYFKVQKRKGTAIFKHLQLELVALLAYTVCLLVLDWRNFIWLVFIPWQASQGFIVGINFVQHDGCDADNSGFNFARNLTGRPFNWVFLNNGFHTVHHMHPGLHWSKTPEAHARLVAPHIHPNLVADNALVFFWKYFFAPGTRQTYEGLPYSPPEAGEDEAWFYDSTETYS